MDLARPSYKKPERVLAKLKNLSSQDKDKVRGGGLCRRLPWLLAHGRRGHCQASQVAHIWRDGWWPHLEVLQPAMPLLFVNWWVAGSKAAPERESIGGNSYHKLKERMTCDVKLSVFSWFFP